MALVYSSNQQPTTSADAFWRLIQLLVGTGQWVVQAASDGTTLSPSPYSVSVNNGSAVTSAGSGAGGFNNDNAWIRIKMAGNERGFVFRITSAASNTIAITYFGPSSTPTNIGSVSASVVPVCITSAREQQSISTGNYVGTLNRVSYWADNTAPYGFGMHGWSTAGSPTFHFVLEAIQTNTYHPLNQDPYIIIAMPSTNNTNFLAGSYNASPTPSNSRLNSVVKCWIKYNMVGGTFWSNSIVTTMPGSAAFFNFNVNQSNYTTVSQAVSTYDGKDEEIPIQYMRIGSSETNFNYGMGAIYYWYDNTNVGTGTYIKYHLQYRTGTPNLDVLSVNSAYDRICFGHCTVPNGGVFPSVP